MQGSANKFPVDGYDASLTSEGHGDLAHGLMIRTTSVAVWVIGAS